MRSLIASSFVVSALLASYASAASYTVPGGAIPDNLPATPLTMTFAVPETGTIAGVTLTLTGLTHTWAGDITAILTAPGGVSADLLRRPGVQGTNTTGDSTNLGGDYRFIDGAADPLPTLSSLATSVVLPSGDYAATSASISATASTIVSLNSTFAPVSPTGTWTLTVSDSAGLDTGTLGSATLALSVVNVPEPTTLGLLAGAGLTALRRRR